jgi:hypothetical protein
MPLALRSNANVCSRSIAGVRGSNTAECMDIQSWVRSGLCMYRSVCRATHSFRGFLPRGHARVCVRACVFNRMHDLAVSTIGRPGPSWLLRPGKRITRRHIIWYDVMWYGMIWYMIWYDMWYDICYDIIWYDIFVNCNCVVTRWQQKITHIHKNSTQKNTM